MVLRTVEDACPYNVCGGRCAAICLVLAVYFMRATNGRPYKSNKILSMPVGEDSISSRNVVRIYQKPSPVGEGGSRRLTDEVSVSLFAQPFGGAQTNVNHLNPCRDRRPRLSVRTTFRRRTNERISLNLGRGGACSSRVMFAQPLGGEEIYGFSIPR